MTFIGLFLRRKCSVFPWIIIISHVVHLVWSFRRVSVCQDTVWNFSMNLKNQIPPKIKLACVHCYPHSFYISRLYAYCKQLSHLFDLILLIFETFKEKHLGQNRFLKNCIKSINKQTQDVWTIFFPIYFSPPKTYSRLCFVLRC